MEEKKEIWILADESGVLDRYQSLVDLDSTSTRFFRKTTDLVMELRNRHRSEPVRVFVDIEANDSHPFCAYFLEPSLVSQTKNLEVILALSDPNQSTLEFWKSKGVKDFLFRPYYADEIIEKIS